MSAAAAPGLVAEAELLDGDELRVVRVGPESAEAVHAVILAAFGSRPPVHPPAAALAETPDTIGRALADGFGLLALIGVEPVGSLLATVAAGVARLGRVSVVPERQRQGIAATLVAAAMELLAMDGAREIEIEARREFPEIAEWWRRHGFEPVGDTANTLVMRRRLPVVVVVPTAEDMIGLGRRLAALLRPGDVVIASGDLGAGKTTLTQGLGAGLEVGGPVISPTFVLSRIHPPLGQRPGLVHVDAYRLGSFAELEDLDLYTSLSDHVTLIEWGAGIAEGLSDDRLEIDIRRGLDPADDTRWVFLSGVGPRWAVPDLERLTA